MKTSPFAKTFLALSLIAVSASSARAALMAADNASDAAYNSGFNHGTNGGSGFGAWVFNNSVAGFNTTNSGFAGEFIGDSALNGGGASGNINVAGESWGLYSNSNNTASATRSFLAGGITGTSVLGVGESFALKMDNGFLNSGQSVGFGLQNSSGTNRLEFYFVGGTNFYQINVNGSAANTTNGFTADGLDVNFTQGAANAWTLNVGSNTYSSTTFGALAGSDISQVRLFNFNPGAGTGARDAYFNSFAVTSVPEPASALVGLMTAGCLVLRRRRR
jgi:hypothetical protein